MIEVHHHDSDIHELRLANPPANALSPQVLIALRENLAVVQASGARAVVLSGQPGMFSAGLDVPYLLTLDRDAIESAWGEFLAAVGALARSPVPVVAAITGHSPAGGAVLALACDYRVMARSPEPDRDFTIGLNEVRVGIPIPRFIFAMARLAVGQRRAEIACTTGRLVSPDEALAIGFVDRLADAGDVVNQAVDYCRDLLRLPPETYLKGRAACRRDLVDIFDRIQDDEVARLADAWFEDETQAALKALVERLAGSVSD